MASQISEYKCPACTGPLRYDSDTGLMKCDYCDSTFTVAEIEALYAKENAAAENAPEHEVASDSWGEDGKNMAAYSCPSCGAELIYDSTVAVASCPYCGNNTVIPAQFKGALKPDYVIPFKLNKEQAMAQLLAHMKKYKLVPKEFTDAHTLEEVKSVYVPYWLFTSTVSGRYTYNGKKFRTWEDHNYRYTETSVYCITRDAKETFENVPVDGSEKMDDTLMESIEPYDYSALTPFKAAYLAGFPTDRYDVKSAAARESAVTRMKKTIGRHVYSTVSGFTGLQRISGSETTADKKPLYVLMPVWLMHATWEGKRYTYAVNGQTGKTVGNLPMSKQAYRKHYLTYAGIFAAALIVVFWFFRLLSM